MSPLFVFIIPFMLVSMIRFLYRRAFHSAIVIKDKVVLVTGASSGLGEACAKRYAREGAKVVLCARNVSELNRVKKEISADESSEWPLVCPLDVTKFEDVDECVKNIERNHGPIYLLVSNAGCSQRGSVEDTVLDVHQKLMNINYFGQVHLVKAVLPFMIKRKMGQIISIGSVQGQLAIPFRSAYSASKHASQAFFDSLRAEVARNNISVTVVNPGYIRTNLSKNALSSDGGKHGVMDRTTAKGMKPEFVTNVIIDATVYPENEVFVADALATVGLYLRTIFPWLYFKYTEWRANNEWKTMKKQH